MKIFCQGVDFSTSSVVLIRDLEPVSFIVSVLGTEPKEISKDELGKCGVNYCPASPPPPSNTTLTSEEANLPEDDNFTTSKSNLYLLAGVYLVCSLVSAIVVALFVDPLSRYIFIHSFIHSFIPSFD